jgi:hypothetical protein
MKHSAFRKNDLTGDALWAATENDRRKITDNTLTLEFNYCFDIVWSRSCFFQAGCSFFKRKLEVIKGMDRDVHPAFYPSHIQDLF